MEKYCQQHQSAEKYTSSNIRCLPLISKIEVRNIVKSLKYKSCLLNPLPAFILKFHVVRLLPSIYRLLTLLYQLLQFQWKSNHHKKKTAGCKMYIHKLSVDQLLSFQLLLKNWSDMCPRWRHILQEICHSG